MKKKQLLCITPGSFRKSLKEAYQKAGVEITFHSRQIKNSAKKNDPYGITSILSRKRSKIDGVLLVSPINRSPSTVLPGPVIGGIPCGVVFANTPSHLKPWLNNFNKRSSKRGWAVMSMFQNYYLIWGKRFLKWFRNIHKGPVASLFENQVSRSELVNYIATGPSLLLYVGHGRPSGLTGYYGLRWCHIAEAKNPVPCGAVVCFSCSTLKQNRGKPGFGMEWVASGRAGAFLGSVASVKIKSNSIVAAQAGNVFNTGKKMEIGSLMQAIQQRLESTPKLSEGLQSFNTYRIVGNPLQSF